MKGKTYVTRYPSIVPKNSKGVCMDVINTYVYALKIEFGNGEIFWFMMRDLKEVAE